MSDPALEIREGGEGGAVIQTLREGEGGGLQKTFFRPFGSQFGLYIREGLPGSATVFNQRLTAITNKIHGSSVVK